MRNAARAPERTLCATTHLERHRFEHFGVERGPSAEWPDALRALRERPETKDIPVIALTAAASERGKQRGESAGFYRYRTEPIKVAEFVSTVEALLASLPPS